MSQCHDFDGKIGYCNSGISWQDPDTLQSYCEATGCNFDWSSYGCCNGDDTTDNCDSDNDCVGYNCSSNCQCLTSCSLDSDCQSGFSCVDNECIECTRPTEDLSINGDTVFCQGTYYLNDTSGNGVITINVDNVELDCNGAKLYGNSSIGSIGIYNYGKDNVIIKNCELKDYKSRLIELSNVNNNQIINTTFVNATDYMLNLVCSGSNCYNTTVENSTFYSYGDASKSAIYVDGHNNLLIKNNNFNLTNKTLTDYNYAIKFEEATSKNVMVIENRINGIGGVSLSNYTEDVLIEDNIMNVGGGPTPVEMQKTAGSIQFIINSKSGDNTTIINNSCSDSDCLISLSSNDDVVVSQNSFYNNTGATCIEIADSTNVIVDSNTINITDTGIVVDNSSYVNITNNYIEQAITNVDGYILGIRTKSYSSNIYINNTIIKDYGSVGILIRQTNNIIVNNTDCQQLSLDDAESRKVSHWFEPTACIAVLEVYKSYIGDGTENEGDDITKISNFKSTNIVIGSIAYDSDVQTILESQGTENLEHELTDYWYRKVQLDTNLTNTTEFYINNEWENLTTYYYNYYYSTGSRTQGLRAGYITSNNDLTSGYRINFTIAKNNMAFKNIDTETNPYKIKFFNLSSIAPYNDIYDQTNEELIVDDADEYNLTLEYQQKIMVSFFSISLFEGYNLISIPLNLTNSTLPSPLDSIEGEYEIVWGYDSGDSDDQWKSYSPSIPEIFNDLNNINPNYGYWIKATSNSTLEIGEGFSPKTTVFNLKKGYNLIGYPSLTNIQISEAIKDVKDNLTIIWAYKAEDASDQWKSYSPTVPEIFNDLTIIEPTYGYWIDIKDDVTWIFNSTHFLFDEVGIGQESIYDDIPPIASKVYGSLMINNELAEDGTEVMAYVNDTNVENTTTIDGFYSLTIDPDGDATNDTLEGGIEGEVVTIKISGYNATTFNWSEGELTQNNISILGIDISNLSVHRISSNHKVFEFRVKNVGSTNLTNINWSLNLSLDTIYASKLINLTPNESIFVYAEYNYTQIGDYTITATAFNSIHQESESIELAIPSLELWDLSVLDSNNTKKSFEFIITDNLEVNLTNVNWTLDTGLTKIVANDLVNLVPDEDIYVFIDYNYTQAGSYTVNATAINGSLIDLESLELEIT